MSDVSMDVGQSVDIALEGFDVNGNPVTLDPSQFTSPPAWSVDTPADVALQAAADGLSAVAQALAPTDSDVTITVQVETPDVSVTVTGTISVNPPTPEAPVTFNLSFGTPV